jgi:hypothetical protein
MSITDPDLVSELSRLLDARLLGAVQEGKQPTYAVVPRVLFEEIVVWMVTSNDLDDQPTYRSPIGPITTSIDPSSPPSASEGRCNCQQEIGVADQAHQYHKTSLSTREYVDLVP